MKFDLLSPFISKKEFELFEQKIGGTLPSSFQRHYLKYNGGRPSCSYFKDNEGEIYVVQCFLSISSGEYTIEGIYVDLRDYIPQGLIPFASDPGGNYFCVDFFDKKDDAVYFWSHDTENGAFIIANSFGKFLKELDNIENIDADFTTL